MHQSLLSLLFPVYRRRVLGLLLLRPDEALHGREIARRTGLPAGTISRELAKLTEAGLLKREKRGNQQVYSADTNGPIFTELASILRKTSGLADVLVQALAPAAPKLRVAFVFGSVAQGRETAGSDIDVMLIGSLSFREAVELLHPTQAVLGREVNPKVFATDEFMAKLRSWRSEVALPLPPEGVEQSGKATFAPEPFLADVLAKPKLFLIGNAHDLDELVGHQP